MAENKEILVKTEGSICTLTLNRPEKRNSLTPEVLGFLTEEFLRLGKTTEIRCVVIRGSGDRAFCSGYDIAAISEEEIAIEDSHPLTEAMRAVKS